MSSDGAAQSSCLSKEVVDFQRYHENLFERSLVACMQEVVPLGFVVEDGRPEVRRRSPQQKWCIDAG